MGAGPRDAALMVVGEQPGDVEDQNGKPFVGPAGTLLDKALTEAGMDPEQVFKTNVVKHFRFRQQGRRRIHVKPDLSHMVACTPGSSKSCHSYVQPASSCLAPPPGELSLDRSSGSATIMAG